jgi:propionyl-CoA carboxylase beta chain
MAEIAVLGAEGAVSVLHRRELMSAPEPEKRYAELVEEYRTQLVNPYVAAERGLVDDVIEPRYTRPKLIRALRVLRTKRVAQPQRKHNNIPL